MRVIGKVVDFSAGERKTEIRARFPKGTAVTVGERARLRTGASWSVVGIVEYAGLYLTPPDDGDVRIRIKFPAGVRVRKHMSVALSTPPDAESVPINAEPRDWAINAALRRAEEAAGSFPTSVALRFHERTNVFCATHGTLVGRGRDAVAAIDALRVNIEAERRSLFGEGVDDNG